MKRNLIFLLMLVTSIKSYSQISVHGATGIPGGTNYTTLKGAFDAINATTSQSGQNIEIRINSSTIEPDRAQLNYKSWTSLTIYPTAVDLIISANNSDATIRLNGTRNVLIDGRVNRSGTTPSLTIINSNSNGSSVSFLNASQYCTLKYCKLKAQPSDNYRGIVYLGSSSSTEGNSFNIIEYNEISGVSENERPRCGVSSNGTLGKNNNFNEIRHNNVFNFINKNVGAIGINIGSYTEQTSIHHNSIYETIDNFEFTVRTDNYGIRTNSNNSLQYIDSNYIGGNSPEAQGTWKMRGRDSSGQIVANFSFTAIFITGRNDTASKVSNNIIRGFHLTTGGSASNHDVWDGIFINSGNVDVLNNVIGSPIGNNSIYVEATNGGTFATSHGILNSSSGTVNITGNTIGSLEIKGFINYAHSFESIYLRGSSGTTNVINNLIGSTVTSNSIFVSGTAENSVHKQDIYGVYSASQNLTYIRNNTVANLHNAYTGIITSSRTRGVRVIYGSNYVENNTVFNISSASNQSAGINNGVSVIGIESSANSAGTIQTLKGNTVYNIGANNGTAIAVSAYGIYFSGPTNIDQNSIERNFIYGINSTSTSNNSLLIGLLLHRGNNTSSNNIITLGNSITQGYKLYGIWDDGGVTNNNNIYHNTVIVNGNAVGSTSISTAIWNQNSSIRNYRNNIFANLRTLNGSGSNNLYSIRVSTTTNLTIDYNNYWTLGNRIGNVNPGPLRVGIIQWRIATSQDANSIELNPEFQNSSGNWNIAQDFLTGVLTFMPGISLAPTITQDYDYVSRFSPPKMGAFENNNYVWYGTVSTDFNNASNWAPVGVGTIPPDGADVRFANNPINNCHLDQTRTIRNIIITNASGSNMFHLNGKRLILTGLLNFSNGAFINAKTAGSVLELNGITQQTLPTGSILDNEFANIDLNNISGFLQSTSCLISESLILTNGAFSVGANTLTLNGSIQQTTGTLLGGSTSNIIFGGTGSATILPEVELNNLTINRPNGINMSGNVSVVGILNLTSGILSINANRLTISGSSPTGTGNVDASNSLADLVFSNVTAITLLPTFFWSHSVNNLNILGSGGITSQGDFIINGILNLQSPNPSAIKGILDLYDINEIGDKRKTITMGANAITIGLGDVTGKIKRNTIAANIAYTFGSQFTTITFTNGINEQLPNNMTFIVKIGEEHPVASTVAGVNFIERYYEIIRSGGTSPTRFNLNLRYLENELNGNTKSNMVFWDHHVSYAGVSPHEHGVSFHNTSDNYMTLASHSIGYLVESEYNIDNDTVVGGTNPPAANFSKIWLLANRKTISGDSVFVWIGPYDNNTNWADNNNWADNKSPVTAILEGVPATKHYIYIQNGASHAILPDNNFEAHSLFVEEGGKLEAKIGRDIKLQYLKIFEGGSIDAFDNLFEINGALNISNGNVSWNNAGVFNAGTSNVKFTNSSAAIAGNTDFYNLQIYTGAKLSMIDGARIGILNDVQLITSGVLNTTAFGNSVVDYLKDGTQTVITPENNEYSTLILSGSGFKTLSSTINRVKRNLEIRGAASSAGTSSLYIDADLIIDTNATFASGNFNHLIKGDFENNGLLTPASGFQFSFNGTSTQFILGSTRTSFANLNISNTANVQLEKSIDVNGSLILTSGNLIIGSDTLGINGTVSGSSKIDAGEFSSISFSGNSYTLPNNIFLTNPTIQNLIVNKSTGENITLGNQTFTISANLVLISGVLDVSSKAIIINGNIIKESATMTTNSSTELIFNENSSLLSLPNNVFSNNNGVGILSMNRAGGIALGNQDVIISNKLILAEGLLTTNSNLIILGNSASVGTTALNNTPGSISSYINGCVRKIGNAEFTYPIGSIDEYAPLSISAAEAGGLNSDAFDACYYFNNPNTLYNIYQLENNLNNVSSVEYWNLYRSNGNTNNVKVTLTWDTRSGLISDINQLVVAHWNGLKWESKGASARTGDIGSGSVVSENNISSFSPFTLGSLTPSNPLPISLVSFEATCSENGNFLSWKTISEQNNAYFIIESSADSKKWDSIGLVFGNGNTNSLIEYRFSSVKRTNGLLYRIKQVDFDGNYEVYGPVTFDCNLQNNITTLYPNPAKNEIFIDNALIDGAAKYEIFNSNGQIVKVGVISSNHHVLNISDLKSGKYVLKTQNEFISSFQVVN